jgi:hypothetical protein
MEICKPRIKSATGSFGQLQISALQMRPCRPEWDAPMSGANDL